MHLKKTLLYLLIVLSSFALKGQGMSWVTFEELPVLMRKKPKPVMVFVHTNWCKYCLIQEQTTFADSATVLLTNENYYAVKLNAELQDSISFLGRTYYPKANGTHDLVRMIATKNGQITYPTTVFLSEGFQIIGQWQGLMQTAQLLPVVQSSNSPAL